MPNRGVAESVRGVNDAWVKNMTQALITHYRDQLDFVQGALAACKVPSQELASLAAKAKQWAQRNFGRKLKTLTLTKFDQIVKDLGSPLKDLQPSPPIVETPRPSLDFPSLPARKASGGLFPGQARDASTASTPKRRRSLSSPSNSPTQTQASKRTCTNPRPSKDVPSYSSKAKSPIRPNNVKKTSAPRVYRFPNLTPEQKGKRINGVWEIPKVTKDILVLGDSNLSKVTWVDRPDAQVYSYPGLKLHQLFLLLQSFKFGIGSPNPGMKPSKLVISVGLNDRGLVPSTNSVTLRKVVNEAKRMFPGTKIFLAQIQFSKNLAQHEQKCLSALNDEMKIVASGNVSYIPAYPSSKFTVVKDNIHWTENCANATMNHFLKHLN